MKVRILVVEDDQIIQLDLRKHLSRMDYLVVGAASTGPEAIEKAAELQPDLVLMDVRLRGAMNGKEAARVIQANRSVPVIYLTAQNAADSKNNSEPALQPYVAKPFTHGALKSAIERALESGQE